MSSLINMDPKTSIIKKEITTPKICNREIGNRDLSMKYILRSPTQKKEEMVFGSFGSDQDEPSIMSLLSSIDTFQSEMNSRLNVIKKDVISYHLRKNSN
jgi:hypothetical protein